VLSRALSAADLLKEIVCNATPVSRGSKSVASGKDVDKEENKSQKSSRSKHGKVSISSGCNNKELMPSCLPNASPTEVVNNWLRNIPIDGHVYEMDAELTEEVTLTQGGEDTSQRDKVDAPESIIEVEKPHEDQAGENPIHDICVETELCDELEVSTMDPDREALTKQDSLQKQRHSSVQVMKVLLGPKLDRSSSLPEVSPVYGRKLSQSAQGLLDCLANLRLIDSDSKNEKQHKYNEVMMILQSLWLQKPSEDEQKINPSAEDEFNPRSSSGVDVSSGSTGSVNGVVEKTETVQGTIPPIAEQEGSLQDKDEEDEVKSTAQACESLDPSKVPLDPVTPDIAERVQGSPVNPQLDNDQENGELQEDVESSENKNESDETPQTTSYKSSGNESYAMKSQENTTSSGTPPSVQRAPLTKRVSQDPDPVWVLSLLKKLEKQFMLHYADAMAEFKVRWDLDDNEMLDKMISELKEEVHKRIQSSINRELLKIQSRAGRGPRPPGNTLSRESTAQTEQRRKRLRVMRNKSILSRSDENYTASGTEYSDQRSDDEYCPCDACMKKKMVSRAVQRAQALSLAPVMMEFDLRKILQMKKDPVQPTEPKTEEQHVVEKEENDLEVVHEEAEETNGNTGDMGDQEPDADANIIDEDKNAESIKDVSLDSETRDPNKEEANDKRDSGGEDEVENEEGEDAKEEVVVNGKTDAEEEEEVEIVEEEDCEKKDSPEGDAANAENSDTPVEAEKEDEMTETGGEAKSDDKVATTGEESTEDKSPEGGSESKDDAPETTEDETPNEESTSEKNPDGNQDGSVEDDANEDGISNTGQDEEQPDETSKANIEAEVNGDAENEMDKCSSVEEDFENDKSEETVIDNTESAPVKQVTKTSVESQPGSEENQTAKLKDLQSFMESVESQADSMVVITKQPPYKEPHGPGNLKDMCNGLTEWQVSPKISNRANKQKKGQ
ncbi:hypothetical protein M9458_034166, partial [Cirrhinus mrigala]